MEKSKKAALNPYERLASAIILQAVEDYRKALKRLKKPKSRTRWEDAERKDECLRFFRSKWFTALTGIDPEYLIRKLDEEAE